MEEPKKTKDYSEEVEEKLPVWQVEAKDASKVDAVIASILGLEKKARVAGDGASTTKLALAVITICREHNKWKLVNDNVILICKRRAQLKTVIKATVELAMGFIDETPDEETKVELINTLRTVSAGKIVVELELSRLTMRLAKMKEADGKIDEASDLLNEVQVETIGSMEVKEKAEFVLEQVRLCMARKDFVRAEILRKKVNPTALREEKLEDLVLSYYDLSIQFFLNDNQYLEISKAYRQIFETPSVREDDAKTRQSLWKASLFAVMSPYDAESSDVLANLKAVKQIQTVKIAKYLLDLFMTPELIAWPLENKAEIEADDMFQGPKGEQRLQDFHKRVVEHNLQVVGKYYTSITTARLAELLQLDTAKTEEYLCDLVTSGQLYARIDRPAGIITFAKKQTNNDKINNWSGDINQLLSLVEKTCHQINKENMVYGITSSS